MKLIFHSAIVFLAIFENIFGDRNIRLTMSEQGNLKEFGMTQLSCSSSYGYFKSAYYGSFSCASKHPTALTNQQVSFELTSLPPHFKREMRMEILHNKEMNVKISIKLDSQTAVVTAFSSSGDERFQIPCDASSGNIFDPESEFYYNFFISYNSTLLTNKAYSFFSAIDSSQSDGADSYMRVRAMQYNIETCDNTCLTCYGPDATNCISCDLTCSKKVGNSCVPNLSTQFLQEGKCVSSCTAPHFNISGECVWIPNCTAVASGNQCTTCASGFTPVQTDNYESQCQTSCSVDFELVSGKCLDKKRNYQGSYLMYGLFSYIFSSSELARIGATYSNFAKANDNSAKYTRCGKYQLLGGFFTNRKTSTITTQKYTANFKYVRVSFKWVLIDYNSSTQPISVSVSVLSSSTAAQTLSIKGLTKQSLCGVQYDDYVGDFSYDYLIPSNAVTLTITNSMDPISTSADSYDKRNKNQYFGIRELSIYAFNCIQSFCITCSSTAADGCTQCIKGYYLLNKICTQCLSDCTECVNGNECTVCTGSRTLDSSKKCVCPLKQYWNGSSCLDCANKTCNTCDSTNSNLCLTCAAGTYLLSSNCVSSCPEQYFPNNTSNTCDSCLTGCKTCTDKTSCTACLSGSTPYLASDGKSCLKSCPSGTFQNATTFKCVPCTDSSCLICSTSVSQCSKCATGKVLQGTVCQTSCNTQYYPDSNSECKLCSSKILNCLECSQISSPLCTKCQSGLYLYNGTCVNSCPNGYYINNSTSIPQCTQCSNNTCLTCDATNSTKCLTCSSTQYKNGDNCVAQCDSNQYPNSQRICTLCSSRFLNCLSCSSTSCNSCINSLYLDTVSNSCGNTCPDRYFKDSTGVAPQQNICTLCDSNCLTCSTTSVNCTSCVSPNYLQTNQCKGSCDIGYYSNNDRVCILCSTKFQNCYKCSLTQCETCNSPFYFVEGQNICLSACPPGYATTSSNTCIKCTNVACKSCLSTDLSQCDSCYPNSSLPYLSNNACVSACQSYEYVSSTNECQPCSIFSGCATCTEFSCQSCVDPLQFLDVTSNQCVASCPLGLITRGNLCMRDCPNLGVNNCYNCTSTTPSICLECENGYFLESDACSLVCPVGKYGDNQKKCQMCNIKFQDCIECSSTECTVCNSPSLVFDPIEQKCQSSCTYGATPIPLSIKCQTCTKDNCKTCDSANLNTCLLCDTNSIYQYLEGDTCVANCSPGFYLSNDQCLPCGQKFNNCILCDINQCQQCDVTYYLGTDKKSCLLTCLDKQYGTQVNGVDSCLQCQNARCQTCNPISPMECLSCDQLQDTKYLENSQCHLSCSDTTFSNSQNECIECNTVFPQCDSCTTSICTSCESGYYLDVQSSQCLLKCPPGKFGNSSTQQCDFCQQHIECEECNQNDSSECLKCSNSYFLSSVNSGVCVSTCTDGTYPDSNSQTCESCTLLSPFCKKCIPGQCVECEYGDIYLDQNSSQCVHNCPDEYYKSQDSSSGIKICQKCQDPLCKSCQADGSCLSCLSTNAEKYLIGTQCVSNCPVYKDDVNQLCVNQCNPNETPDPLTKICEVCLNKLYNLQCLSSCTGEIVDDPMNSNKCVECSNVFSNCVECNSVGCTKCDNLFYLTNGTCQNSCPSGTFKNNQTYECVSSCTQSGYYSDQITESCEMCDPNYCQECVDNSEKCTVCVPNKYLYLPLNKCYSNCPYKAYLDLVQMKCLDCAQSTCLSCDSATKCNKCEDYLNREDHKCYSSCPAGKYKYLKECVTYCPVGSYLDTTQNICFNCPEKCLECTSFSNCTKCTYKYQNLIGSLTHTCDSCANGFYEVNGDCQQCDSNCMTCVDSPVYCLSCPQNYNLNNDNICIQCNSNQIFDNTEKECVKILTGGVVPNLKVQSQITKQDDKIIISALISFDQQISIVRENWGFKLDNFDDEDYKISYNILKEDDQQTQNNKSEVKRFKILVKIEINQNSKNSFKQLLVDFKDPKNIVEIQNFGLKKINLLGDLPDYSDYSYPSTSPDTQIISVFAASSYILLMMSSPFYLLVSFFDILQLTNYLLYLNIQYPSFLYNVIKLFDFANFEVIPNLKNNHSHSPFKFKMEKIDTFVYSNLIQSIAIWSFSLIIYFLSKLISKFQFTSSNIIVESFRQYHSKYFYQIIIGLGFLTYCDLLLSVCLQFYDNSSLSTIQIIGIITALILLFGIISLNMITIYSTQIEINELIVNNKVRSIYGFLYSGIELNKKKALMNILFLFRKTIVIQQLVFNEINPVNQTYICCLCVGVESTVMMILKPYKSQKEYKLHLISRFLLISSMIMIIVLGINEDINNLNNSKRILVSLIISIQLVIVYISQVSYLIYQIYQILKRRYLIRNTKNLV